MARTNSIPVRGTCKTCGTVVNRKSAPGRVTWRGECPKAGCKGVVLARRIKENEPAPEDSAGELPAGITRAKGYRDDDRRVGSPPDGESGGEGTAAPGDDAGGDGPGDADEHDYRDLDTGGGGDDTGRPRRRRRARVDRPARGTAESSHPYAHLYPI